MEGDIFDVAGDNLAVKSTCLIWSVIYLMWKLIYLTWRWRVIYLMWRVIYLTWRWRVIIFNVEGDISHMKGDILNMEGDILNVESEWVILFKSDMEGDILFTCILLIFSLFGIVLLNVVT